MHWKEIHGTYENYLRSSQWHATRNAAMARAGFKCQLCSSTKTLHVHHNTYERVGNEQPTDLCVLCENCHRRFHRGSSAQQRESIKSKRKRYLAAKKQENLRTIERDQALIRSQRWHELTAARCASDNDIAN